MLTGIRSLKTPGPGAVAHMSLHQKTNDVKEPSNERKRTVNRSPIYTGGPAVRSVLATDTNRARKIRQRRVGEGHIWAVSDSVNRLFAILLRGRKKHEESVAYGETAVLERRGAKRIR